jgi:hypothetical protein
MQCMAFRKDQEARNNIMNFTFFIRYFNSYRLNSYRLYMMYYFILIFLMRASVILYINIRNYKTLYKIL